MITESMFVLAVPNLEVSGVSYRDVFGFKIQEMGTQFGASSYEIHVRS